MTNTMSTMHMRLLLPICTLHATDVADASPAVTKLARRTGNTNESNCWAYLYMYITVWRILYKKIFYGKNVAAEIITWLNTENVIKIITQTQTNLS